MGMSFAARRKFPISMSPPMAPSRPLPKARLLYIHTYVHTYIRKLRTYIHTYIQMRKSKEVSRRKDMSDDLAVGIYGLKVRIKVTANH